MSKRRHRMPFGAELTAEGHVRFRLWAPGAHEVELVLHDGADATRSLRVPAVGEGWFELITGEARAGSRYKYRIDGKTEVPDPASRRNPANVHGPSEVVDPTAFEWDDESWRGRPWHEAVVYELHVGTFSPEGTFAGVEKKLDHLVELGVTAIELMPIADFPGQRGWGYDGVLLFAPESAYGPPEELKSLVAAAHRRGIAVMLDVVYNHFGPEGNYLMCTRRSSLPSDTTRRGARPSISIPPAHGWCGISTSTTPSTGWRNFISTGCDSTRSTPLWMTAGRTS